jgi:hypothetical protein
LSWSHFPYTIFCNKALFSTSLPPLYLFAPEPPELLFS